MDEQPAIQPGETAKQNPSESSATPKQSPLKRVIGRLPYTSAFKQRLTDERLRRFEERKNRFDGLASIDDIQKQRLRNEFNYSQLNLSETETWIEAAEFYGVWVIFGIAIPLFVVAPDILARLFNATIVMDGRMWGWPLRLLICTLTGTIAFFISLIPVFILGARVQDFFNITGVTLCWGIVLTFVSSTYLYWLRIGKAALVLPSYELVVTFVIQLGLIVPLFLVTALVFRSFRRILERRRRRFHPRDVVIDQLLTTLREMEMPGFDAQWTEFSQRKILTGRLEVIASTIENHFMQFFWTGSAEMDRWTDRDTTEMANGVRQLIKWIIAPQRRTKDEFKARIANYFTASLASEWGRFDRVSAQKVSTRQGAKDRVFAIATALLTAAVPVLLLLLLRRLNVVSAEPLVTYLTVGAYIWAALSLLSRVDPQYAAKLGALKDLTTTLPFGKKGGGE